MVCSVHFYGVETVFLGMQARTLVLILDGRSKHVALVSRKKGANGIRKIIEFDTAANVNECIKQIQLCFRPHVLNGSELPSATVARTDLHMLAAALI